jgi:hypothetical protein
MILTDRLCLAAFVVFAAATGLFLLGAPHAFYADVPGVAAAGAFDAHLLRDVGLTYMTLAGGVVMALIRPSWMLPVTSMAALYLGCHAAIHALMELAAPRGTNVLAEMPGVYLPALLACGLVVRARCAGY